MSGTATTSKLTGHFPRINQIFSTATLKLLLSHAILKGWARGLGCRAKGLNFVGFGVCRPFLILDIGDSELHVNFFSLKIENAVVQNFSPKNLHLFS